MAFMKNVVTIASIRKLPLPYITTTRALNTDEVKEIKIPVPWGHIAGKWWGDEKVRPILAIHGWQDNAGSFDPMLERFPETQSFLAIDCPGHGFSSHIPPGQLYSTIYDASLVRRIQKYFNWDKVTLMGHSRGAEIASTFSAVYPDTVDCFIGLDMLAPYCSSIVNRLGQLIDLHLKNMTRKIENNIEYTEDDIKSRWIKATRGSLNEDSVAVLMKRGTQKSPHSGRFIFTRDNRLKLESIYTNIPEKSRLIVKNLKCHCLVIKFKESKFFDHNLNKIPDLLDVVKLSIKSFELHEVEGTHHGHMSHPLLVNPVISKFLERL